MNVKSTLFPLLLVDASQMSSSQQSLVQDDAKPLEQGSVDVRAKDSAGSYRTTPRTLEAGVGRYPLKRHSRIRVLISALAELFTNSAPEVHTSFTTHKLKRTQKNSSNLSSLRVALTLVIARYFSNSLEPRNRALLSTK